MIKFYTDVAHSIISIYGVVVLMRSVLGNGAKNQICDHWANMSRSENEPDGSKNCTLRFFKCTIMDCFGSTTISREMFPAFLENDTHISYCFGMQINDCSDPISMDFYIQAPSRNRSKTFRITENNEYTWEDLSEHLGLIGSASPTFDFTFNRNANSTVNLAVILKVTLFNSNFKIIVPGVEAPLIHNQNVPVKFCSKTVNITDLDPDTFAPDMCNFGSFSDTLNKTCDLKLVLCGPKQICDMALKEPKCICDPSNFKLNTKRDACIFSRRLNQLCGNNDECGINEVCRANKFNVYFCQCRENYFYSAQKDMCADSLLKDYTVVIVTGGGQALLILLGLSIMVVLCCARKRSQPPLVSHKL